MKHFLQQQHQEIFIEISLLLEFQLFSLFISIEFILIRSGFYFVVIDFNLFHRFCNTQVSDSFIAQSFMQFRRQNAIVKSRGDYFK